VLVDLLDSHAAGGGGQKSKAVVRVATEGKRKKSW